MPGTQRGRRRSPTGARRPDGAHRRSAAQEPGSPACSDGGARVSGPTAVAASRADARGPRAQGPERAPQRQAGWRDGCWPAARPAGAHCGPSLALPHAEKCVLRLHRVGASGPAPCRREPERPCGSPRVPGLSTQDANGGKTSLGAGVQPLSGGGGIFKSAAVAVLKQERKLMTTGDITRCGALPFRRGARTRCSAEPRGSSPHAGVRHRAIREIGSHTGRDAWRRAQCR